MPRPNLSSPRKEKRNFEKCGNTIFKRKKERQKERKTERKKTNSVASNLLAMASNLEEREEKGKKEVQKESKV